MGLTAIVVVIGLALSFILFQSFPMLPKSGKIKEDYFLSIIIPARNEEKNLPLLLSDLQKQVGANYEVICVDDGSADRTAEIAKGFGVKVISITKKPLNWLGKSWACQKGAEAAQGNLILFLDADVRLEANSLNRLIHTYFQNQEPLSVLPYHKMKKSYEQLSLFFNLTQVSANGLAMKKSRIIGLYGPIILLSTNDYWRLGGHQAVKDQVIEDVALGICMKEAGIAFHLFMGDSGIYYRMYAGGFSDLYHGWLKNYASGALVTPPIQLLMVFLWVTAVTSVPLYTITLMIARDFFLGSLFVLFYFLWVIELQRIAKKVGNFQFRTILFYPVTLCLFVIVFLTSTIKRIFHFKTQWKGRSV